MRYAAVSLFLVLLCSLTAAGQTATTTHHAAPKSPPAPAATARPALPDADVQALRADVTRMKEIVVQMENNLANVSTLQDPLKHQFQLEIDMWNVVIGEMERKLDAAEKK